MFSGSQLIHYQTCKHNILKINETISCQLAQVVPVHGARATINCVGYEVKVQGHTMPKVDLEAWWRHNSRPLWVA